MYLLLFDQGDDFYVRYENFKWSYEEECFLILKSNLPKMKDEEALELYVNLKKSYKKDRGLMRYIFDETEKIAQKLMTI